MNILFAVSQPLLIFFYVYTYQEALYSLRLLFWRTAIIFLYGIVAANRDTGGLLDLVCDWIVVAHAIGIAMAVWNRDSRLYRWTHGGYQEGLDG
jgi:hypothetical protein